jgi:hypothetical protein
LYSLIGAIRVSDKNAQIALDHLIEPPTNVSVQATDAT